MIRAAVGRNQRCAKRFIIREGPIRIESISQQILLAQTLYDICCLKADSSNFDTAEQAERSHLLRVAYCQFCKNVHDVGYVR